MTKYRVKKIDCSEIRTPGEYQEALTNAPVKYCNGLNEVWNYCGGKLHRQRVGYSGCIGDIEYIAERC